MKPRILFTHLSNRFLQSVTLLVCGQQVADSSLGLDSLRGFSPVPPDRCRDGASSYATTASLFFLLNASFLSGRAVGRSVDKSSNNPQLYASFQTNVTLLIFKNRKDSGFRLHNSKT